MSNDWLLRFGRVGTTDLIGRIWNKPCIRRSEWCNFRRTLFHLTHPSFRYFVMSPFVWSKPWYHLSFAFSCVCLMMYLHWDFLDVWWEIWFSWTMYRTSVNYLRILLLSSIDSFPSWLRCWTGWPLNYRSIRWIKIGGLFATQDKVWPSWGHTHMMLVLWRLANVIILTSYDVHLLWS